MRAPSSYNTQPWRFYVLTGDPLDRLRRGAVQRTIEGVAPSREVRIGEAAAGAHRARQIEIAKQLFAAMGIERQDQESRQDWVMRGFRQFDAPVSVIVTYDRSLQGGDIASFDCGGVVNALVNAAWSRGLGCVINSQGIMHSAEVRAHAGVCDEEVIMIAVAMGFPDDAFPANAVVSTRKPLEEAVVLVGFED
jgi:nitroreductase